MDLTQTLVTLGIGLAIIVAILSLLRSLLVWWTGINEVITQLKANNLLLMASLSDEQLKRLNSKQVEDILSLSASDQIKWSKKKADDFRARS